jgi:hypothetical protein
VEDCQPDFSEFQRTRVDRGSPVSGITHGYKMTKTELQSALAEATQTDKKTAGVFLDTLGALAYKEIKKNGEFVLPGFRQAGEAEEESAYGF